ncbi:M4 family metallopeptidase [Actinomadura yumaensis]|uniref:M4 family metallopeptidase n=1 Tax=Actinomadura yumaensis TaxID=111807 RepID=UPI0036150180
MAASAYEPCGLLSQRRPPRSAESSHKDPRGAEARPARGRSNPRATPVRDRFGGHRRLSRGGDGGTRHRVRVIRAPAPSPATAADRFVASGQAQIKASPKDRVVRKGVTTGAGGLTHISYERTYAGLPVQGGDFVVTTDASGKVLGTAVNQTAPLSVTTTPKVSAATAAKAAARRLPGAKATKPTLTVLAQGSGRLAYETVLYGVKGSYGSFAPNGSYGTKSAHGPKGSYGTKSAHGPKGSYGSASFDGSYGLDGSYGTPSILHVYVDAATGKYISQWDEVVAADDDQSFYHGGRNKPTSIATTQSGGTYTMRDPSRTGISCGNQSGTVYSGTDDAWGNAVGNNLETACVDALKAAQSEYDMVKTWLERNGLDGNGRGWPMRVGLNQANAFWNGSYANFGRNNGNTRQATPTDVVAHELGHGIFQYTPGGSAGSNEKGGLNESTGDIFGALTEWYLKEPRVTEQISGTTALLNYDPPDYEVGEEVNLVGSGPIRSMSNPSSINGNPNCYSSRVPPMEVHAAAGVQNHWFYLLAEGSNANDPGNGRPNSPTCNNSTVTGVGVQKAGRIFMETLNMKTSTWTHGAVRKTSLQAVINLVRVGKATCTDFTRTRDAWNAVSVPAASGEPTTCTS